MTRIKICGIKTLPEALAALEAGADLLGFNFYPKSPRFITPETCAKITTALFNQWSASGDKKNILLVGVFVNAPVSEIRATLMTTGLHLAQLHGDEPPEVLDELGPLAFKAVRLSSNQDSAALIQQYSRPTTADVPALLIDAAVPGLYGGSGQIADWNTAAQLAKQTPLLLAGGLTPENVAEAIRLVRPWGVDVASGVESAPGVKDLARIKKFIEQVHRADTI
ncbi:MAG: N-(5'-phosphoribosyl)anthranilate isomerase [Anaerolineae bacterium]|nr:MAG: N-(5'-phosphoribosyl)anthranilate isomerase [Anaerolineae bacterium]